MQADRAAKQERRQAAHGDRDENDNQPQAQQPWQGAAEQQQAPRGAGLGAGGQLQPATGVTGAPDSASPPAAPAAAAAADKGVGDATEEATAAAEGGLQGWLRGRVCGGGGADGRLPGASAQPMLRHSFAALGLNHVPCPALPACRAAAGGGAPRPACCAAAALGQGQPRVRGSAWGVPCCAGVALGQARPGVRRSAWGVPRCAGAGAAINRSESGVRETAPGRAMLSEGGARPGAAGHEAARGVPRCEAGGDLPGTAGREGLCLGWWPRLWRPGGRPKGAGQWA
jgi:hypothetical protein